jgi:hypothetical protein
MCLVFGMIYYHEISVRQNTKYQIPNTKHTRKKFAFLTFYECINIVI